MGYTYGFIGAGNMGGALAQSVIKTVGAENVFISCKDEKETFEKANDLGCNASDNAYIANKCDYIFLGVKPQMMADMLKDISPLLFKRNDEFILVSMAAGLSINKINEFANGEFPVIRIMPNTPVSIGNGMILATKNDKVSDKKFDDFKTAMAHCGRIDYLSENLIDAGCAVSGCGPAFVYMFIEALADGGVECGLPRDKAIEYASQTVLGAAKMVIETNQHPEVLKDAVCSPGGSTIAGVHSLENNAFRATAMEAVKSAFERTKELGK
ncbi:MAG: pyrroline-5-carboxylate reductase [Ruminococcaceae bacterium]|nr:pyrroline-5-carboxylate reductase [Oscillospiraceae bacterium]